jgi:hypothetical protein
MRFKTLKIAILFLSLLIMNSANFVYIGTANAVGACDSITKLEEQVKCNETAAKAQAEATGTPYIQAEISLQASGIYDIAFNKSNQCISEADKLKITSVLEEPLDLGKATKTDGVKICVKNTICAYRSGGFKDCISSLVSAEDPKKACATSAGDYTVTCKEVEVYFGDDGIGLLFTYISLIYKWGAGMIGLIAVLVIIISGIQISAAAGEQAAVTSAKNRIFQSILGLVILFFSAIILYSINPTFFTNS